MDLSPGGLLRSVGRVGAAAQNGLEIVRYGGLQTTDEPAPFEVVSRRRMYRLRRYFPDAEVTGTPMLLIPPLMLSADVYDVAPTSSAVRLLHERGVDPWVVDFGAPDRQEGGLERTLADHVVAVSEAIDEVRAEVPSGRDVHLAGYSQGGMFCYQAAAYRRGEGIASLVTFGAPVDLRGSLPLGIPEQIATTGASFLANHVFNRQGLPAWAVRTGFRMLDPVKSIRQRLEFLLQLHDRQALLPREGQRRFLEGEGWVGYAGPAIAELLTQFVVHNRMVSGGFMIDDRLVTLADLRCPVLCFYGEVDDIAQPAGVRAIRRAVPLADVYEMPLRAGHMGLVVGSAASSRTWPAVADWVHWQEGAGARPESITELTGDEPEGSTGARLGYGLELATEIGMGTARVVTGTASRALRAVRGLSVEAADQLPRLLRLEYIRPRTRISLGLLLDERVRRAPEEVCFVFADRAYTNAEVARRIDNVVRGLISTGIRQGDHVGVLMATRPSVLAVIAALNRIGAVAVVLRPDGDVGREIGLGEAGIVITDPEHAGQAVPHARVLVLGGGAGPRGVPEGALDLERVDPAEVALPGWYRPDPGIAVDLAFLLFTGEGESTRPVRVSNRRWALSSLGTASSAALTSSDTVYSMTPIHHPSCLLTALGGAVAGGARIALASSFDPDTFWDEVRRYGVTVVSYTWALPRSLVAAPPHPGEPHHPIRLFVGAGLPPGLWRRVTERFAPARVLEFYASTEGEVVLVNLSGAKPGAAGRPLPGSAEVRLAGYDVEGRRLLTDEHGFALPAADGEPGMLLARPRTGEHSGTATPIRGVFTAGDSWYPTGDLFCRDRDGDHWLLDVEEAVIRTSHGPVYSRPVHAALADIETVDLAVSYALAGAGGTEVAVTAVTVLPGADDLDAAALQAALGTLDPGRRPDVVHVVASIPLSASYRPMAAPLCEAGMPTTGWYAARDGYRRLTPAARRRLAGA